MIRPVGVDHPDLGDGRVPVFRNKILLTESDVVFIHRKSKFADESGEAFFIQSDESGERFNGFRDMVGDGKGLRFFERRFSALDRVDHVIFDRTQLFFGDLSFENIHACGVYERPLSLGDQLDTLGCAVCPLVELAGQKLDGKDVFVFFHRYFVKDQIQLGFGEDRCLCVFEEFLFYIFDIVPIDYSDRCQFFDAQQTLQFILERACFVCQSGFLFNKYPVDHISIPFLYPDVSMPICRLCMQINCSRAGVLRPIVL